VIQSSWSVLMFTFKGSHFKLATDPGAVFID
jgi:hypothetical protein